jgi:hypothetical protein
MSATISSKKALYPVEALLMFSEKISNNESIFSELEDNQKPENIDSLLDIFSENIRSASTGYNAFFESYDILKKGIVSSRGTSDVFRKNI